MRNRLLELTEAGQLKKETAKFEIGDQVKVHQRILEGAKERVQTFDGVVIARKGEGLREMFTVRKMVQGEGVERIFPIHSPKVAKIEVLRTGRVRRAKLYYLRDRVGKAMRLRERTKGSSAEQVAAHKQEKADKAAKVAAAKAEGHK